MPQTGRAPQKGLEPRDCVVCKTRFQPYRDYHITCGARSCRAKARDISPRRMMTQLECKYCGVQFMAEWSGIGPKPPCPRCAQRKYQESQGRKNAARRVAINPEVRRAINLRGALQRYGLTVEQYQAMVDAQDNRCAICGDPPDPNGIKSASRLHVDHDHVTKTVRSLLCVRCNQGVGYFKDDPALFHAAAEYIERHRRAAINTVTG